MEKTRVTEHVLSLVLLFLVLLGPSWGDPAALGDAGAVFGVT